MPKTKKQKEKIIEEGIKDLNQSRILIFTDFTGVPVNEINTLRELLRGINNKFKVFKKRLFQLAAKNSGLEIPKLEGQLGVVFGPNGLEETAKILYKFSQLTTNFKILGGLDIKEKKFLEPDFIKMIGSLPSREVLLGQVVFMLTVPLKKFLLVLNEKAKRSS